jgi:hypothetical protein
MAEMTTRSAGEIIQWRYFGEVLIEVPADIQQQATEGADPARLPGCVLQAAFGYRAQGQWLGSFTHWIFAALLTMFFPSMVTAFAPGTVFVFFCFMMVLQLVWVKTMVLEKKVVRSNKLNMILGASNETAANYFAG